DEIRSAQEELSRVFSEAGQSFYQQQAQSSQGEPQGAPTGTPEGDGAGAKAEDVVEADYEIVDDKK
nr:molecular chaperone DnaK [Gemmatimonadota bacterium]